MKLGIIRCMQTEDYCPGTTDFAFIREKKGAFEGVEGDILETLEKRKEALVCFEQAKSWYPSPEVAQRREELLRGKGKITPVIQGR